MSEVARLRATIGADDGPYNATLDRAEKRLDEFGRNAQRLGDKAAKGLMAGFNRIDGKALQNLGGKLTLGLTVPAAAAGAAMFKLASDTSEAASKIDTVFGKSGESLRAFAETAADGLGMSRLKAMEAAGGFGVLLKTSGVTGEQLAQMSQKLVTLSGDLTSFHNVQGGAAAAAEKLRAGLVGEAEPLRTLGILLSDAKVKSEAAAMGLGGVTGELTEADKVLARYNLIMREAGDAHGDFNRTGHQAAGQTRKLQAEFENAAGTLGKELLPAGTELLKWATGLVKEFNAADPAAKKMLLTLGVGLAVGGPLLTGLGTLVTGLKSVKDLLDGIGKSKGLSTVADAVGDLADDGDGAVGGGRRKRRRKRGGAPDIDLGGGIKRRGLRLDPNAKMPGSASWLARAGDVAKNVLGRAALPAAVVTGGVMGANWLNDRWDEKHGKEKVGFGDQMGALGLNPWYNPGKRDAELKARQEAEWAERKKSGQTPRQLALKAQRDAQAQRVPAGPTPEDPKAADARFDALMAGAEARAARAGEGTDARAELAQVGPVLQARYQELLKRAKAFGDASKLTGEAAEAYWKIQKEGLGLEEQMANLRQAAAKEAADAQKKTWEKVKQASEERFDIARSQAEANATEALDEQQNLAKLIELQPVLLARMREVGSRSKEYWDLNRELAELKRSAAREEEQNIQRAAEQAQKVRDSAFEASLSMAESFVRKAGEEGDDAEAVRRVVPVLKARQAELVALTRGMRQDTEEFQKLQAEYWEIEGKIGDLQQASSKEQKDNAKSALEKAEKASKEQQDVLDARVRLREAELKGNPFLSDRQRKEGLIPTLLEQFRGLAKAAPGESELEALKRRTSAAEVRSEITEALGVGEKGSYARTVDGGLLPLFDVRRAQSVMTEMDRIARAGAVAAAGPVKGAGGPNVTVQVAPTLPPLGAALYGLVFRDPTFQEALGRFMQEWLLGRGRRVGAASGW